MAVQLPQFMHAVMSPPPNFATSLYNPGVDPNAHLPPSYSRASLYR